MTTLLLFLLLTKNASAAKINDISILEVGNPSADTVELKLRSKEGQQDSFFFVGMSKSDPKLFSKLAMLLRKLDSSRPYVLNLDIKNFSRSPSGSFYRSESVDFMGTEPTKK